MYKTRHKILKQIIYYSLFLYAHIASGETYQARKRNTFMILLTYYYAAFFKPLSIVVSHLSNQSLLLIAALTCNKGCTPALLHIMCC